MSTLKLLFKNSPGTFIVYFAWYFLFLNLITSATSYSCKESEAYEKYRHPDEARGRVFHRKFEEEHYCFENGRSVNCKLNAHERKKCAVNPYAFLWESEIPIYLNLTDDVEDMEYRYIVGVSEFRNTTPVIYVLMREDTVIPTGWASCKLFMDQVLQAKELPGTALQVFSQQCFQIDLEDIEDIPISYIPSYFVLYGDGNITNDLEYLAIKNKMFIKEGRETRTLFETDEDITSVQGCFPYLCPQTASNPFLRIRAYDCEHHGSDCNRCAQYKGLGCMCNAEHKCVTDNPQQNDQVLKEAEIARLKKIKENLQDEISYYEHDLQKKNKTFQQRQEEENYKQKYEVLLEKYNETKQALNEKDSQLKNLMQALIELKGVAHEPTWALIGKVALVLLICIGVGGVFFAYFFYQRKPNNERKASNAEYNNGAHDGTQENLCRVPPLENNA